MTAESQKIRALEERIELLEAQVAFPKLMTAKQVADAIGIAEGVFYEYKQRGDAPPAIYFTARNVRYDRDDVVKWWNEKKVGAGG